MIRQIFTVPPEASGQRVDDFLRQVLPRLPESALRQLFDRRDLRLDGTRLHQRDTRLQPGQQLTVFLPESASSSSLDIVYEDEDVMLVNKPAGISVEADEPGRLSLSALCLSHVRRADPAAPAPLPCHRLDHQTCGLCLFAKGEKAHAVLLRVFRERTLDKRYECMVRGIPKPPRATCRAYLLKDPEKGRVFVFDHPVPGGKTILTAYETLEAGPISRLSVHLLTGRTHQIRAHLAALGHPILGDDLYGDRRANRETGTRSLQLCAVSLRLDTGGQLPRLDGRDFYIHAPF